MVLAKPTCLLLGRSLHCSLRVEGPRVGTEENWGAEAPAKKAAATRPQPTVAMWECRLSLVDLHIFPKKIEIKLFNHTLKKLSTDSNFYKILCAPTNVQAKSNKITNLIWPVSLHCLLYIANSFRI